MLMKSARSQQRGDDRKFHTSYRFKNKMKVALFEERFGNFPGQGTENHKKTQNNMCTGLGSSQTPHRI
jgi:hypothetical protein